MLVRAFAPFFKAFMIIVLLGGGILGNLLYAKEPTNYFFGFGMGADLSQIDSTLPEAAKNGLGLNWTDWTPHYGTSVKEWGFNWEFLVGYKHFLTDIVGFRYYLDVGAQHYKNATFTDNKLQMGVVEYSANTDLLLNFYNGQLFTFGIFGGFGVGGAYFDSPAVKRLSAILDNLEAQNITIQDKKIYRNRLNVTVSLGTRFNLFQKIPQKSKSVCERRKDGKRVCRAPALHLEHSIEFLVKFPLLTYQINKGDAIIIRTGTGNNNTYRRILYPSIEVKNPYKINLRYIIAF